MLGGNTSDAREHVSALLYEAAETHRTVNRIVAARPWLQAARAI